jgi:hypothetical protein
VQEGDEVGVGDGVAVSVGVAVGVSVAKEAAVVKVLPVFSVCFVKMAALPARAREAPSPRVTSASQRRVLGFTAPS